MPISVADAAPADAVRNGPLYKIIKASATDARRNNAPMYSGSLATDAKLTIFPTKITITDPAKIVEFLKVVSADCQGPLSIDEGKSWVQTSRVCHVGSERKIRRFFPFKLSPEIDLEFNFRGEKLVSVFATELLWLPGGKLLQMDAAEHLPDEK